MGDTLSFDDKLPEGGGWTSFFTYEPDQSVSLNNRLYTVKNGELYIHNEESVNRNTFYGVQSPSKMQTVINEGSSDVKVFQTLNLEGNKAWSATIRSYVSDREDYLQSTIDTNEFVQKEGEWFAYMRRNEQTDDFTGKAVYGIGNTNGAVTNSTDVVVSNENLLDTIAIGDQLFVEGTSTTLGIIVAINQGNNTLTVANPVTIPDASFVYGRKDVRIEGAEMRGYVAQIDLEIDVDDRAELFVISSEIFKSFS